MDRRICAPLSDLCTPPLKTNGTTVFVTCVVFIKLIFHEKILCSRRVRSIGESLFTLFASLTYAYHYLMMLIKEKL